MLDVDGLFCASPLCRVYDLLFVHLNDPVSRLHSILKLHRIFVVTLGHLREVKVVYGFHVKFGDQIGI